MEIIIVGIILGAISILGPSLGYLLYKTFGEQQDYEKRCFRREDKEYRKSNR